MVGTAFAAFQFTVQAGTGVSPLTWTEVGPLPSGLNLSTDGVLSGTPTVDGIYPISLSVSDALRRLAKAPITVRVALPHSGSFTLLPAQMTKPRSGHTATLLGSDKVLIAGGGAGVADASAELYNPAANNFTATAGPMTEARINHTATLLSNPALANYGKVLIVGPDDMTAELYDPATDRFAATGSMHHARMSPTATLLSSSGPSAGNVLIVGGNTTSGDLVAELYDPATGTFSDTGSTTVLRTGHTATLLSTGPLAGQVLIAGGNSTTAELYNPVTHTFAQTGGMTAASGGGVATRLGMQDGTSLNGSVLFAAGSGGAIYAPSSQTFTATGGWISDTRYHLAYGHTASLRNDGTVLVAGGYGIGCGFGERNSISQAVLFAPEIEGFVGTTALNTRRDGHTATVLADGTVLVLGGTEHTSAWEGGWPNFGCRRSTVVLDSAELFK